MVEINIENTEEAKCLLDFTEERMHKKKGVIMLFTGESGDGKSYSGVRFLQLWYKKWFNEEFPSLHICNNLEESILAVRDFKRIGEGILIEELSVHAGKRDALTTSNKLWNSFVDICRIKQAVIIGNCPHISFVDSHFQMMCHAWVNCNEVNFKKQIVIAHPLWLQTSPHKKEPYKHKFLNETGEQIDFCYFKLPNEALVNEYDKLKDESNENIFEEIILKMRNDRIKKLKQLGQKVMPKREMEAYVCALNGLSPKESAKKMKLKYVSTYKGYLTRAKNRLKDPKYRLLLRELPKNEKIMLKGVKKNEKAV